MRLRLVIALVAVLVAGAPTAEALAQGCQGAPGTSAVDQYCESVPGAGGGSSGDAGSAPPSAGVSPATADKLAASGASGQALKRVLEPAAGATARADGDRGGKRARRGAGTATATPPQAVPAAPSGNPLAAVKTAATGGAVLGGPMVWALLAATVLAIGVGLLRTRRRA